MSPEPREDTTDAHPLFTGTDGGREYLAAKEWRKDIEKAKAE